MQRSTAVFYPFEHPTPYAYDFPCSPPSCDPVDDAFLCDLGVLEFLGSFAPPIPSAASTAPAPLPRRPLISTFKLPRRSPPHALPVDAKIRQTLNG
jgi:hypothetical protein